MPQDKHFYAPADKAYKRALGSVSKPIPKGANAQYQSRQKSRAALGTKRALGESMTALARSTGGTNNPLYAAMAPRLAMGAQAQMQSLAADIEARAAERDQELEMARRGQMLGAATTGVGMARTFGSITLAAEHNALAKQGMNQSFSLGMAGLDLNRLQFGLKQELGRGGLALDQELGRGGLALAGRNASNSASLGWADLAQRQQGANRGWDMAKRRFDLARQQQDDQWFQQYPDVMGGGSGARTNF